MGAEGEDDVDAFKVLEGGRLDFSDLAFVFVGGETMMGLPPKPYEEVNSPRVLE